MLRDKIIFLICAIGIIAVGVEIISLCTCENPKKIMGYTKQINN
jgi:hypothetical protein